MLERLSGELALEPLLARIAELACELAGADSGTVGLYIAEQDAIGTSATCNVAEPEADPVVPRGEGLAGQVLALDATVRCRYGELPRPLWNAAEMQAIGVPIHSDGAMIAVLCVCSSQVGKLDAAAQALLEEFARHAAIAIGNARRYALEQRRAARLALLLQIAGIIASGPDVDTFLQRAADVIHELLGYPGVDIPLIDEENPDVLLVRVRGGDRRHLIAREQRIPIDTGIMGAAARQRCSLVVNEVAKDPRYITPPGSAKALAELAVPIMFGEEMLGVLNVEGDAPFDDLDRQSMEVIAEYLALAIQGARSLDQSNQLLLMQERQRLARDLHDNVTQILSSISMISQSLADAWKRDPAEGAQRAARLSELSQMAFAELRALLKELSPAPALRSGETTRRLQVPVGVVQLHQQGLALTVDRFVSAMMPVSISKSIEASNYRAQILEHEEALLRICQEAASNAIRHAGANRLEIEISVDQDHAWLRIRDDGRGISAGNSPGMGMANMWQRLLSLGGALHIAAGVPSGTQIEARLPRKDRAA